MTLNIVQEIQKQNENHVQSKKGKEEEIATYGYPSTERRRSIRLLQLSGDKTKLIEQNDYSGLRDGTNGGKTTGRGVSLKTIVQVKLKERAPSRDKDKLQNGEKRGAHGGTYIKAANGVKQNRLVKKVSLIGNKGKTQKVNKKKIEKGVIVEVDKKKNTSLNKGSTNSKGTSVKGIANKVHSTMIVKKKKHKTGVNREPLLANKGKARESKGNSLMGCKMRIGSNFQRKEKEEIQTGQVEKEPSPVKDNLPCDKIKSGSDSECKEDIFLQKRLKRERKE
ncbi:Uncharacterized protein PCOAH_00049450 [Plasmodium coatneyi]|uniref:Uncharacterized protein n=1 Tax=Plasmodium coatneyi TaxID=208452 RepID=A0A1B1E6E0_9APIC|nr:Uncharacterized protein PCOAH_00049450 [Plasmodium coatneyi]ANQ10604.1 Uncharacterized protein PCOAH_00049450 [Plasmodium coatneyi]